MLDESNGHLIEQLAHSIGQPGAGKNSTTAIQFWFLWLQLLRVEPLEQFLPHEHIVGDADYDESFRVDIHGEHHSRIECLCRLFALTLGSY